MNHPNIVIAGASGYIGRAVLPELLKRFPNAKITALSRNHQQSNDPRVSWKPCDLFSLKQLEQVIPEKVDLAFYLVHSMGPTAQLDQGSFADYDLILADNFARAIKKTNLQQLIYLGGLIPDSDQISLHLKSRLEIEETFESHSIPTTIFRAALILGDAGSSFQILLKLVDRLPIMICPRWTQSYTTPVDLSTVLSSLVNSALVEEHVNRVYDLAGCKKLTYVEMMKQTAKRLGKKRFFLTVSVFTPTLSRLWVSLITNTPKNLVYPLVESLEHDMVARESHLFSTSHIHRSYEELLNSIPIKLYPGRSIFHFRPLEKTVRSVQRLPLPPGKNAKWVMQRYIHWLPDFFRNLIQARLENSSVIFSLVWKKFVLLHLSLSPERSSVERELLYIIKGGLVAEDNQGRLEFRVVLRNQYILAAVHDFRPALPWFVYRYTQAKAHLYVMRAFAKILAKDCAEPNENK